jgi:hypothetical protein
MSGIEFAAFDQGCGDYPIDPPVVGEVGQTALGSAIGAGEERLGPIPPSAGSRTWPENSAYFRSVVRHRSPLFLRPLAGGSLPLRQENAERR